MIPRVFTSFNNDDDGQLKQPVEPLVLLARVQ